MKRKIAFTTCVQLGLSCIEEIYRVGGKLDLLITLKDEKAKNIAIKIAQQTESELVEVRGHTFILYKRKTKKE